MTAAIFRPAEPADAPAIHALLASAFPHETALAHYDAEFYDWKYWRPRADFSGPRAFVLTRGTDILAHSGVVPGRCLWSGGEFSTLHMIDWVARPGSFGAGASLLKHIGRTCDALLAIGGTTDTRTILPALGFRSLGDASKFHCALRPLRGLASSASLARIRPVLRAGRNIWRQLGRFRRRPPAHWRAHRLAPADLTNSPWPGLNRAAPTSNTAIMQRGAGMLEHLLDCPVTSAQIYRVKQSNGPAQGYFVLSRAGGQARLADCWVDSENPADWSAMLGLVIDHARQDPRSTEIIALSNQPVLSAALIDAGFWEGSRQPVLLRTRPGIEFPLAQLEVQLLDNDMAWMPGLV